MSERHEQNPPHRRYSHGTTGWHDHLLVWGPAALLCALALGLFIWLVDPAPPKVIVMSAGPKDSALLPTAEAYREILARNGITLKVLTSDGSVQNLQRLLDPKQHVDVALVQGGIAQGVDTSSLMSLGSVFYAPIVVFYRGKGMDRLSQLAGKRVAIGREGSGTRRLSLALLKANGIEPGGMTTLLPTDGVEAARQVITDQADAAFFNGDSATRAMILRLLQVPGVSVMNFSEAAAYTRLFPYLNEIDLPPGLLDLGHKIPPETIHLISPTVEIVARSSLHPAVSDLIIEAAQQVHGTASMLQRAGEFPSPIAHEYRISEDAMRYYRSGKSFFYRSLPFWLASLADRLLVILLPALVLLVPALRTIPALYRWRVRSRIYRWYGSLIAIERGALSKASGEEREALLKELDHIEESINRMRMPLAHADAFYVLREHVGFVRYRLTGERRPGYNYGDH
jgi:NMT1 family protein